MLKSVIVNSKKSGTDFNCFSFDSEFNSPECLIDILLSDHSFVRPSSTYLPVILLGAKGKMNKKKILKPGIYEVERKPRLLKLSFLGSKVPIQPAYLSQLFRVILCFIYHVQPFNLYLLRETEKSPSTFLSGSGSPLRSSIWR